MLFKSVPLTILRRWCRPSAPEPSAALATANRSSLADVGTQWLRLVTVPRVECFISLFAIAVLSLQSASAVLIATYLSTNRDGFAAH
jgi:hypothetical protein